MRRGRTNALVKTLSLIDQPMFRVTLAHTRTPRNRRAHSKKMIVAMVSQWPYCGEVLFSPISDTTHSGQLVGKDTVKRCYIKPVRYRSQKPGSLGEVIDMM